MRRLATVSISIALGAVPCATPSLAAGVDSVFPIITEGSGNNNGNNNVGSNNGNHNTGNNNGNNNHGSNHGNHSAGSNKGNNNTDNNNANPEGPLIQFESLEPLDLGELPGEGFHFDNLGLGVLFLY